MLDKGTTANLISVALLALGSILAFADIEGALATLILSVGTFAFSGGITNSIAVKMLFDKVPGLYGSGVIQSHFAEIRTEIKSLILDQFFTEDRLRDFLRSMTQDLDLSEFIRSSEGGIGPIEAFVEKRLAKLKDKEVIEAILAERIDDILGSSIGGLPLGMIGRDAIEALVSKFVFSLIEAMESKLKEEARHLSLDSESLGFELDHERIVKRLRATIDSLVEQRLEALTPIQVKRIMEDLIRNRLGWLVVWGNIFGGLIGFVVPFVNGSI